MQQQVTNLNNLDTFVILKGNQLKREHLPASAGLPSSAGLFRSRSFGGDSLNGVAADGQLLTNLLSETRRRRRSDTRKPMLTRYTSRSNNNKAETSSTPNLDPSSSSSINPKNNTPKKNGSKSAKASQSWRGQPVGSTASTTNLKSKAALTEETDNAEQRRARSLIALADIQKKIIQQTKKTVTRVTLNKALDNLELQERGTKTRYSIASPMTTTATIKDRKRVQSAKRSSDVEIAKLKAIQDEKKRVAERSSFLLCRAQFIGMNSIVRSLQEAKWKKSSADKSKSYEV